MYRFFVDDSEFPTRIRLTEHVTFVLAGYLIPSDSVVALQQRIAEIKELYEIPSHLPVKWNLKDLREVYEQEGGTALFEKVMKCSDQLRADIVRTAGEFDAKIIASAITRFGRTIRRGQVYKWVLANLLQRLGMLPNRLRGPSPRVACVMDFPGFEPKQLSSEYRSGYVDGEDGEGNEYIAGPLKDCGLAEGLLFGSAAHFSPLQPADMIAGITKDFLIWALRGTKETRVAQFFPLIAPYFHKRRDQVHRVGLVLKPAPKDVDIDGKIAEICASATEVSDYGWS